MRYLAMIFAQRVELLLLLILFSVWVTPRFAAPVMVDVKIYASGDPEAYIYCATGSLAPPARFVANGSVPEGQESYC